MRDKIKVLYYPDMVAEEATLKKAILFFDEIHFMDRPSFTFDGVLGTIGTQSPLRRFEQLFRRDNVPVFIHDVAGGPIVPGNFLEQISTDVNDSRFLSRFQEGLQASQTFRNQHIQRGSYADIKSNQIYTAEDIAARFAAVDIPSALASFDSAMGLLRDKKIPPYALSDPQSCAKTLIFTAAVCSVKMNLALEWTAKEGFIPLADAGPYGTLLRTKYVRAVDSLDKAGNHVPITDLAFAIFDELVSNDVLSNMSFADAIRYRHDSTNAREEFLEYLGTLHQKLATIGSDEDYTQAISLLVTTEIVPAAKIFRNKMATISESFVGALAKGAMGAGGAFAGGMQIFGDLSLNGLISLAGVASAYVGHTAIDAWLAQRAVKRECSLSYILTLD